MDRPGNLADRLSSTLKDFMFSFSPPILSPTSFDALSKGAVRGEKLNIKLGWT